MKKMLLFFAGIACASLSFGQLKLNEFYVRPNNNQGSQEFFEVKNFGPVTENSGCYSLVSYFKNNQGERGFFRIDFPSMDVAPGGFLVASSVGPNFQYQNGTAVADFSWNNGHINRFVHRNGSLQMDNTGAPYHDVFLKSVGSGNGNSGVYATFLFRGTELVDAFLGSNNSIVVPSFVTEMGALTTAGTCGTYTYDFSNVNNEDDSLFGYVVPEAGVDNGYYRIPEGCASDGRWAKASNPNQHTPGTANPSSNGNGNGNGNGGPVTPLAVTTECLNDSTLSYDITAGSQKLFPVKVSVYYDANGSQMLDAGDVLIARFTEHNANGSARLVSHPTGQEDFIFVFDAKGTCNDIVEPLNCPAAIILPVTLQSFSAVRSGSNVLLNWTTATEINNRGFYVQRLQGSGEWQDLTFVPSAANGGNSSSVLQYSHSDLNMFSGVTQYRLKQVDIDGHFKYSEVRSVRSDNQGSRGMLIYPNPSHGTVNLQFANVNGQRDVMITDMAGRIVRQWRSVSAQNLQLSGLTPGVYSVKVIDQRDGSQETERLVVSGR
jgi:hypothetical protein